MFANDGTSGFVYIQYWLINYDTTSPGTGWIGPVVVPGLDTCWYKNSTNASSVPNQPITNLANLSLGGTVSSSADSYFFSTGSTMYAAAGDNAVNAAAGWNTAEFCVVGDGNGSQTLGITKLKAKLLDICNTFQTLIYLRTR